MCIAPAPMTVATCLEKPSRQTRRVVSERSVARRDKLRARLIHPEVEARDDDAQTLPTLPTANPGDSWQTWLASMVASTMIRISRCERVEQKLRDLASYRAIDFWEDDQEVEVETVATRLDRDPVKVVAKLRRSPAGLEWLLKRWRFLASLDPQTWTDEQKMLANRLVSPNLGIDPTQPGYADGVVAELEATRAKVEDTDAILRSLVELDMSDAHVPGLASLHRYSRSLHRQMTWYLDQIAANHPRSLVDSQTPCANSNLESDKTNPLLPDHARLEFAKTNPLPEISPEPESDKTNPSSADVPETKFDETNPIPQIDLAAKSARAVAQVVITKPVAVLEDAEQAPRDRWRKLRPDPVKELARRKKAARRR